MLSLKEKWMQWLFLSTRKMYLYAALFLVVFMVLIAYFTGGPGMSQVIAARNSFEHWSANPTDKKLEKQMRQALRKIPGLERSQEGDIVQRLIAEGASKEVKWNAVQCIERLRKGAPLHATFAEGTLLIEEQNFQRALEISVGLKEQMDRKREQLLKEGSALYACNLLRIAFLQKQLKNEAGELAAWEEIKSLKQEAPSSGVARFLESNFKQQAFSLNEFISQREQSLESVLN